MTRVYSFSKAHSSFIQKSQCRYFQNKAPVGFLQRMFYVDGMYVTITLLLSCKYSPLSTEGYTAQLYFVKQERSFVK